MNYCSNCGSNALKFSIPEGDHLPRFICSKCHSIHYQNPRMIVGCIIENEKGEIMLCKRGIEPRLGFWNLPCGFLENNETVEDGAIREVFEETGAKVQLGKLHSIYNLVKAQQVYLIFQAKMQDDHYQTTPESTAIEFFPLNEIPWDQIAFSSNSHAIEHLIQKRKGLAEGLSIGSYQNQN